MNNKQVALITGALTGIGRATAMAFAETGAQIVVSGRREAAESDAGTFDTNVLGTLLAMKHELRVMEAVRGHGLYGFDRALGPNR